MSKEEVESVDPSMEEILASIRQIISEPDEDSDHENDLKQDNTEDGHDSEAENIDLEHEFQSDDMVELDSDINKEDNNLFETDSLEENLEDMGDQEHYSPETDEDDDDGEEILSLDEEYEEEPIDQEAIERAIDEAIEEKDPVATPEADMPDHTHELLSPNKDQVKSFMSENYNSLLSDQPATQAMSNFKNLVDNIKDQRAQPIGSGARTLEEMTKELLRPMLKEWLDENLPHIVERLVAKEITKLVNSAEN